ncbi:amino acid acetyltransferase [Fibrobacteres bacterium R8-0-B4]
MQPQVDDGALVARTAGDLTDKMADYAVYVVDGTPHACGALHTFPVRQGEVAAIVVDEKYASRGIGKKMVSYLIEKATRMKLKSVFVLTTLTADWFKQLGFVEADVKDLPEEKRGKYNKGRNSLVLMYQISPQRETARFGVE